MFGGPEQSGIRIDAVDIYRWLPGRFAVLHTVDAKVGDSKVEGAEIIGWDPARDVYVTQYFGSDGPNSYEATLEEQADKRLWRMRSAADRFIGIFRENDTVIEGHWELADQDGSWQPWMEIILTRESGTGEWEA
jgi:hypothetical protein